MVVCLSVVAEVCLYNRPVVLVIVGTMWVLVALLAIITFLLFEQREAAWVPQKADGAPLVLEVTQESPVVPVEYRDCADHPVVVVRSDVAQQFEAHLDAMGMWSSNEAGCLEPGAYEDYLRQQGS